MEDVDIPRIGGDYDVGTAISIHIASRGIQRGNEWTIFEDIVRILKRPIALAEIDMYTGYHSTEVRCDEIRQAILVYVNDLHRGRSVGTDNVFGWSRYWATKLTCAISREKSQGAGEFIPN